MDGKLQRRNLKDKQETGNHGSEYEKRISLVQAARQQFIEQLTSTYRAINLQGY